jgi:uncharacterized membrane protein
MSALRKWFVSGLLVIVPVAITIGVLQWLIGLLDQTLLILPKRGSPTASSACTSPASECC